MVRFSVWAIKPSSFNPEAFLFRALTDPSIRNVNKSVLFFVFLKLSAWYCEALLLKDYRVAYGDRRRDVLAHFPLSSLPPGCVKDLQQHAGSVPAPSADEPGFLASPNPSESRTRDDSCPVLHANAADSCLEPDASFPIKPSEASFFFFPLHTWVVFFFFFLKLELWQ